MYVRACWLRLFFLLNSVGQTARSVNLVCDIWPPYQMKSRDGMSGFSVDVVTAVFGRMDVEIEGVTSFPWKRALVMVEHGRADALFSANYTPDRAVFARYPEEMLVNSPWVIWTRGEKITSLDELKGRTIGVVNGYSYTPEFWDFIETHCTVQKVHSDEVNFKKLAAGRIDATVAEFGNGHYLTTLFGLNNVKAHLNFPIKEDGLYIIFNRDSAAAEFVEEFSEQLKAFKSTDEFRALRMKHFGVLM